MNFTEFDLNEQLLKGLETAGYTTCTDVQEQVLKTSQDGSDLYVQSQTGTGKTAAYLVAIIQEMLSKAEKKGKKALIMVPTRELAVQVEEEAKILCGPSGLKTVSVYGGVGYEKQIDSIKKGADIIIGTPGRLIDLCEGKNLSLAEAAFVVVDEADRMFDMGFYPELRKLLKLVPNGEERQTMLFSATLNSYVKNLAWEYTRDPKEIEIECKNITVSEIDQELLHVSSDEKMKLLIGILKNENPSSVIIFCNTKRSCEVVAKRLELNDIKAGFIIGDLPQSRRIKILNDFKAGNLTILVATDVAARGIDVDDLAMVINYDLPNEAENYVHRIGRTARAGKSGKAYTFCSEQDVYNLPAIERYIEMQIPAKVAYPEQMLEDKSAGVYIKTENWHDDYSDARGGYRNNRKGSFENKNHRDDYKNTSKNSSYRKDGYKKSDDNSKGSYQKNSNYQKDGYKSKSYQKDGYQKKDNYRKDFNKDGFKKDVSRDSVRKSYLDNKDVKNMEGMSFEDRMKIYKSKYSSSSKSVNNNKTGKTYNKNNKQNSYKPNNHKNNKTYQKNEIKQNTAKKGLFAKIKSFFGR